MVVRFLPFNEPREHAFDFYDVADKVIVDNKDSAPPTRIVEMLHLSYDLLRGFRASGSPKKLGNVTELTIERASASILYRHGRVIVEFYEIPARKRRAGQSGFSSER